MSVCVTCDISQFQPIITDAYGRRLLIARVTFGAHYLDAHFLENANRWAAMHHAGQIDGVVLYVVWLASATPAQQYAYAWQQIGPTRPPWLKGMMIDLEVWRGQPYEQHGDHSAQINALYGMHAHRMGSWHAVGWYGNRSDLAELYPGRDPRAWGIVAAYTSELVYRQVPGAIGQQYTDGQGRWGQTPMVDGHRLPRVNPAFGACDHNVFPGIPNASTFVERMALDVSRPPVRPTPAPKPRPGAAPHYPAGGVPARGLVAPGRAWAAFLTDDGKVDVRHNGVHVRYL